MCSDTERLEMLSVFAFCLFIMSYKISDMSLGDIDSMVSYNYPREISCDPIFG